MPAGSACSCYQLQVHPAGVPDHLLVPGAGPVEIRRIPVGDMYELRCQPERDDDLSVDHAAIALRVISAQPHVLVEGEGAHLRELERAVADLPTQLPICGERG